MHPSLLPLETLQQQCRWSFSRASGPGGQHRNKVETAVVIEHLASGIRASASEERSQHRNRQVALQRLRCALAVEYREPVGSDPVGSDPVGSDPLGSDPVERPASELWRAYCRSGKIRVSADNEHFPCLLAEIFEALIGSNYDLAETAKRFDTSSTQLVRFLGSYAPALARLNAALVARGLSPRRAD